MNSLYKPLIFALVVGLYVYMASKSENSVILNFAILYFVLMMISWVFQKIEQKRKVVRKL